MKQINKNNYEIIINNNELFTLAKRFNELVKNFRKDSDVLKYKKLNKNLNAVLDKVEENKRGLIPVSAIKTPFYDLGSLKKIASITQYNDEYTAICKETYEDVLKQKWVSNLSKNYLYVLNYAIYRYRIIEIEKSGDKKLLKEKGLLEQSIEKLKKDLELNKEYIAVSKEYNKYVNKYNKKLSKINDLKDRIIRLGEKEIRNTYKIKKEEELTTDADYRNAFNQYNGCEPLKNGKVKIFFENQYDLLKDKSINYRDLMTKEEVNNILKQNNIDFKI